MISSFAETDTRYKAHVFGTGYLIFTMCDATAKEILKQAEDDKRVILKGKYDDPKRADIIEKIIEILEKTRRLKRSAGK